MKKILNLLLLIILTTFFIYGCSTPIHQISLNTAEKYEKRYTYEDSIIINGEKIKIEKDHPVWILRNDTLKILILTSSGSNVKELK